MREKGPGDEGYRQRPNFDAFALADLAIGIATSPAIK